ncbi:MAG: hypothetical protein RBU28_10555, partial [Bacteroidales bacterium]|nr:hypothetical protein [Bacteroidales bacterium]
MKPLGISLFLVSIILFALSPAAGNPPENESGKRITSSGNPDSLSDTSSAAELPRLIGKVYLHTDRTWYFPGDDIWFKAYLIDAFYNRLSGISRNLHVELISPSGEIIEGKTISLENGLGKGDFRLSGSLSAGKYRIRAYTNYMRNFSGELFFNKEIGIITSSLPDPSSEDKKEQGNIEIDFFPEGGSLVDNVNSIVAFKAVDAHGKGCDVSGTIYSSSGEMVTVFRSSHLGMGLFELKPSPGSGYYAVVKGADGTETRTELPGSSSSGATLSAAVLNDKELSVIVRTNERTLPLLAGRDLKLMLSARKEVIKTIILRINSLSNSLKLPLGDLPGGITMLTLLSSDDLPLAERLIFTGRGDEMKISISPDKTEYKKRDPVSVKLSFMDDSTDQDAAFLSLSAAYGNFMDRPGEYPTNIASWFLLESDVHGMVEGPSYYFDPSNQGRFKDLDLLLLTQGWRDFAWKSDSSAYFSPETGFSVSGRLRKINRDRPLASAKINYTIFQESNIINGTLPVDSSGRFKLDSINITGEARLVLTAFDRNDGPNGLLLPDSAIYIPPEISLYKAAPTVVKKEETLALAGDDETKERETALVREYVQKETTREKYKLSDTIEVGEVFITGRKPVDIKVAKIESVRWMYGGQPDNEIIVTQQMESVPSPPLLLISAGVRVTGPDAGGAYKIRIRSGIYRDEPPLLLIDGIKRPISVFSTMPVSMIERIDVLKSIGKTAVYGLDGNFGVISVITR